MAQIFKNKYALDVGTSFVELYGPSGEVTYSIVVGFTISNKMLNEILIDVRVIDSTNVTTAYLCSDSKLSVGSTLMLAGDLQKIILKPGDTIEIKSNEVASVDVSMAVMENDPSVSFAGPAPPAFWYGDYGFVTGGDVYWATLDSFRFSSETWSYDVTATLSPNYQKGDGASNGVMCLFMCNGTNEDDTTSITFADDTKTAYWNKLQYGRQYAQACSDSTVYMLFGGYVSSYYDDISTGSFASGETGTLWGNLDVNRYYTSAFGNKVYGICVGGYSGSHNSDINYIEYASQGNSSYWGDATIQASYYGSAVAGNATKGLITGTFYTTTNVVEELMFDTQGNTSNYGTLSYSNNKQGSLSDGIMVYFHNGDVDSYGEIISYDSGGVSTRLNNASNKRSGGAPASESGNG